MAATKKQDRGCKHLRQAADAFWAGDGDSVIDADDANLASQTLGRLADYLQFGAAYQGLTSQLLRGLADLIDDVPADVADDDDVKTATRMMGIRPSQPAPAHPNQCQYVVQPAHGMTVYQGDNLGTAHGQAQAISQTARWAGHRINLADRTSVIATYLRGKLVTR